jgi:transposase
MALVRAWFCLAVLHRPCSGTLIKSHPKRHRGAHAVLIVDRAGWPLTNTLVIPSNITIMPLPQRSPELNPVENIWHFMRDKWLSSRVFTSYEEIVTIYCEAWNKLIDQPSKIISIGMRDWAHGA